MLFIGINQIFIARTTFANFASFSLIKTKFWSFFEFIHFIFQFFYIDPISYLTFSIPCILVSVRKELLSRIYYWRLLPKTHGHYNYLQWSHTFFTYSLIIEGTTGKVLHFIMPITLIFYQNLGFNEKNVFLNTTERSKQ